MCQGGKRSRGQMPWTALMGAVFIALTVPRAAWAARPQERMRERLDAVSVVLDDPRRQGSDQEVEQQRLQRIIHGMCAFEQMTREALGAYGARLMSRQRGVSRCLATFSSARTTESC